MPSLPYVDAEAAASAVSWPDVVAALDRAVQSDLALDDAPARVAVHVSSGELLLMPAETSSALGVKVLGIAPDNPDRGLQRIQAVYLLMDRRTLAPIAVLDGPTLTELRTAGVSAFAATQLAEPTARRLVVFGTGPQARAHVSALRAVRPIETVAVVGRDPARVAALCAELGRTDDDVRPGTVSDVSDADVVVCATTARSPLFDGDALLPHACVLAVGSHEPDARELDAAVFARATRVVVEHRATALREAGDVILAIADGAIDSAALVELSELPLSQRAPGISIFKSVGMAWEDLVVADAIWQASQRAEVG